MSPVAPWHSPRDESFGRRLALAPLGPLGRVYGLVGWLNRRAYRRGWRKARRLGARVVSVGSVVAGGSGKTPVAGWLAAALHARGYKVALVSRGHGRRSRSPVTVVSDGRFVHATVAEGGDEPSLLAAHAPGVPVLVGRDRAVVGLRAVSAFGADVIVLDDGFQHHRVARDLEVLTLDGGTGLGNRRCLPCGPLREPAGALAAADVLVVVDGPLCEQDEAVVRKHAPSARRAEAWRNPSALRGIDGRTAHPPEVLRGREVGALCGIATPAGFRRTLEALGASVAAERSFPDHHRYRASDLRGLPATPDTWVTTEKDAVKILPSWLPRGIELLVLTLQLDVERPRELLDWLEIRLR